MAKVATLFYPEADYPKFSFDTKDCIKDLSKSVKLSSNVFIHKTASIGENCEIGCNSIIGPGVKIGENCLIGDNVSIYFSIIGKNVKIYQGVKIGSEGFGFIMNENSFKKIPQLVFIAAGRPIECSQKFGMPNCRLHLDLHYSGTPKTRVHHCLDQWH